MATCRTRTVTQSTMCPGVLHLVFNDMVFNRSKGSHYSFLVCVSTSLCSMPVKIKRSKLQDLQQASPRERIPQISFEYLNNNDFVLLFVPKRKRYSPLYLLGGKGGQCVRLRALPPSMCRMARNSGSLNILQP
jgi:hypothetical protein